MSDAPEGSYAEVNGLEMYHEVHGTGEPLVVLHGAFMSIDAMGEIVSGFAGARRVIAADLQAHGRTADVDRPFSYEQMADDVAALLRHLGIERADFFGYSMGGAVALQGAVRHPEMVRKLVAASVSYDRDGAYPEMYEGIEQITPEVFEGTPFKEGYERIAPNPGDFPRLVEKMKEFDLTFEGWPAEDIRAIEAPTLLIIGDSDVVSPEHAVEMFRLLGGGVPGDIAGLPSAQLAVLPGTTHITVMNHAGWLVSMIGEFLDAPMPEDR